jgi:hypothetical protein
MCTQGNSIEVQGSTGPQHDRPVACVIAQQYSPATFISKGFHFRKKKFGALLKNSVFSIFFYFFKIS